MKNKLKALTSIVVLPLILFPLSQSRLNKNNVFEQINTVEGVEVINQDVSLTLENGTYDANISIKLSTYITPIDDYSTNSYQINAYINMEDSYVYNLNTYDENRISLQWSSTTLDENENLLSFAEDTSSLMIFKNVSGTNDFELYHNDPEHSHMISYIIPKTYSATTFVLYNDIDFDGWSPTDPYYIFDPIFLPDYDSTITEAMKPAYYSGYTVRIEDPNLIITFDISYGSNYDRSLYVDDINGGKWFYSTVFIPATGTDNHTYTGYFLEVMSNDAGTTTDAVIKNNGLDSVTYTIDLSTLTYYSRVYIDEVTKEVVPIRFDTGGDISEGGTGIVQGDVLNYTNTNITILMERYVVDSQGNVITSFGHDVTIISQAEYEASIAAFIDNPDTTPQNDSHLWMIILLSVLLTTILGVIGYGAYRKLVAPKDDDLIPSTNKKKEKIDEEDPDLIFGKRVKK